MNKIIGALMICIFATVIAGLASRAEKEEYLYIFIAIVVCVLWVTTSIYLIIS